MASPSKAAPGDEPSCVMCVYEEGESIAFAAYDESKNSIIIQDNKNFGRDLQQVCDAFKNATLPTMVILGQRSITNPAMLEVLTSRPVQPLAIVPSPAPPPPENPENDALKIPFKVLKSTTFDIRSCRLVILEKLHVVNIQQQAQDREREQNKTSFPSPTSTSNSNSPHNPYQNPTTNSNTNHNNHNHSNYNMLNSVIDFTSPSLVKALGGLLSYLRETSFRLEENGMISVLSVTPLQSSNFMQIDVMTLRSLHIFSEDKHPMASAKGTGKSKEGFSLFTLLNRCKSKLGQQTLREVRC